jgi:hypothetical protein
MSTSLLYHAWGLRGVLREKDAGLHRLLCRQWRIALEHWLPAIAPSSGSYNSYPHLRNVERLLDDILVDRSGSYAQLRVQLSAAEIYGSSGSCVGRA